METFEGSAEKTSRREGGSDYLSPSFIVPHGALFSTNLGVEHRKLASNERDVEIKMKVRRRPATTASSQVCDYHLSQTPVSTLLVCGEAFKILHRQKPVFILRCPSSDIRMPTRLAARPLDQLGSKKHL